MAKLTVLTLSLLLAGLSLGNPINEEDGLELVCPEEEGPCVLKGTIDLEDRLEGDVILPRKSEITSKNAYKVKIKKWKDKTVTYVLHETFNSDQKKNIRDAMDSIEAGTCVKFVEHKAKSGASRNPEALYITSGTSGCSATTGYTKWDNYVSLSERDCLSKQGKIQHELLHVLGLKHEHVRPDRDDYVTIFFDEIQNRARKQFEKVSETEFTTFNLPYDYGSIMHYGMNFYSNSGQPTILPKDVNKYDPYLLGQRDGPSELDLEKVNLMYECPKNYLKYRN